MKEYTPLTEIQWNKIKHLLPSPTKRGRGKPHSPWRAVMNSILFVLCCNAKWGSWPQTNDFASKSAAHRWYLHWDKTGLLPQLLTPLALKDELKTPPRRTHSIQPADPIEELYLDMPLYSPTTWSPKTYKIAHPG